MPVTMGDVVRLLSPDEANLDQAAAALGPEALPHLETPDPGSRSHARVEGGLRDRADPGPAHHRDPASRCDERGADGADRGRIDPALAATGSGKSPAYHAPPGRRWRVPTDGHRGSAAKASADVHRVLEMLALTDPYPQLREMSAAILAGPDSRPEGHHAG